MKKLIKKVLLLSFVIILLGIAYTVVFFSIVPPQYEQNYQAALVDKVQRLENIQEPKIIVVGNSNVAFGINSETIEKEIGMPVVNLGMHAGLGNRFLERISLLNISEGDVVIVAHTDYSDCGEIEQPDLAWITLQNYTDLWAILDIRGWVEILPALPNYIWQSTDLFLSGRGNQISDSEYQRSSFNEYGDYTSVRNELIFQFEEGMIQVPNISRPCVERLNALNDYCQQQGAVLLIAAYPIADGEFTPDRQQYIDFQRRLESEMECEVISDFTDYFYKYEYFYDTYYHLNSEGADLRTEQLIEDINNWNQRVGFIDE